MGSWVRGFELGGGSEKGAHDLEVKTFSWDDLDAVTVSEMEAIVHLAGKAHDTKNQAAAADKVDGVLTEDVVPTPIGPYGESKIAAE